MTPSLLIAKVLVDCEPLTLMVVNLNLSFGASAAVAMQAKVTAPANTLDTGLQFFIGCFPSVSLAGSKFSEVFVGTRRSPILRLATLLLCRLFLQEAEGG